MGPGSSYTCTLYMGNWGYSITPMSGVISPFMTWGPPCRSSHLSKKYLHRQRWTFCSSLNHFCRQGQQTQVHLTRTFCDVDSCPCSNSDSIKSNIPLLHGDHLIFRNVLNSSANHVVFFQISVVLRLGLRSSIASHVFHL